MTTEMTVIPEIKVGVNLGKGQYPEALITEEMIGSTSNSKFRSGYRVSTNRDKN